MSYLHRMTERGSGRKLKAYRIRFLAGKYSVHTTIST